MAAVFIILLFFWTVYASLDLWGVGKYYSNTSLNCQSWHSSCAIGVCFGSTSNDCIVCPTNMYFSLEDLVCYSTWPSGTITISSTESFTIDSLSTVITNGSYQTTTSSSTSIQVCLNPSIYVNYYTSNKLEFGTEAYPYKYLDSAIYSAYNYRSITKTTTLSTNIYIQKIGTYVHSINFPILFRNVILSFIGSGSSDKQQLELYPDTTPDRNYSISRTHYKAKGPDSYVTTTFTNASEMINIFQSQITFKNIK